MFTLLTDEDDDRNSTINPEGGSRTGLNSVAFRKSATGLEEVNKEDWEFDDELSMEEQLSVDDEDWTIVNGPSSQSNRSATKLSTVLSRVYTKWTSIYRRFGLRYIFCTLHLLVYIMAGALIIQAIEAPHAEIKRNMTIQKLERNREMASTTIITSLGLANSTEINDQLRTILEQFERNNSLPIKEISWDIWESFSYCVTVLTIVGFGSTGIYPETIPGRICIVSFALFGVPLLLLYLIEIGHLLCMWIYHGWNWITHRFHKADKDQQQPNSSMSGSFRIKSDHQPGNH